MQTKFITLNYMKWLKNRFVQFLVAIGFIGIAAASTADLPPQAPDFVTELGELCRQNKVKTASGTDELHTVCTGKDRQGRKVFNEKGEYEPQ